MMPKQNAKGSSGLVVVAVWRLEKVGPARDLRASRLDYTIACKKDHEGAASIPTMP